MENDDIIIESYDDMTSNTRPLFQFEDLYDAVVGKEIITKVKWVLVCLLLCIVTIHHMLLPQSLHKDTPLDSIQRCIQIIYSDTLAFCFHLIGFIIGYLSLLCTQDVITEMTQTLCSILYVDGIVGCVLTSIFDTLDRITFEKWQWSSFLVTAFEGVTTIPIGFEIYNMNPFAHHQFAAMHSCAVLYFISINKRVSLPQHRENTSILKHVSCGALFLLLCNTVITALAAIRPDVMLIVYTLPFISISYALQGYCIAYIILLEIPLVTQIARICRYAHWVYLPVVIYSWLYEIGLPVTFDTSCPAILPNHSCISWQLLLIPRSTVVFLHAVGHALHSAHKQNKRFCVSQSEEDIEHEATAVHNLTQTELQSTSISFNAEIAHFDALTPSLSLAWPLLSALRLVSRIANLEDMHNTHCGSIVITSLVTVVMMMPYTTLLRKHAVLSFHSCAAHMYGVVSAIKKRACCEVVSN